MDGNSDRVYFRSDLTASAFWSFLPGHICRFVLLFGIKFGSSPQHLTLRKERQRCNEYVLWCSVRAWCSTHDHGEYGAAVMIMNGEYGALLMIMDGEYGAVVMECVAVE